MTSYSRLSQDSRRDRILVVDDSPDNCYLIQAILEEEGYDITIADSGKEALRHIDLSPPDLVLLDIMMPEMDGFEVTRRIRDNTKLSFTPILLITAYDSPSVAEGLDNGADDFIRKPMEYDELLARVRSLLRLKHSVDERDQIARQREDFVSRLTHDLRTPLVAADRMLNLFQQEALGEISLEMHEAIATMIRSNRNLLQMVNTLLEVYRYEAGNKTLTLHPINLKELLKEVVDELAPLAEEKSLTLKVNLDPQGSQAVDRRIVGDRLELHRVFTNLLGNAIKFTDAGDIVIEAYACPAGTDGRCPNGDRDWAVISITDSGVGIPPQDLQSIFYRFRQGNHKRSGSGLGLHLTHRIVEAHQGRITVESVVAQGSTFSVYLPLS
ncbi:hybrid sensor histidine kinase/response regulator [Geitlerinema sp. PCC 7407]|uniref:hybrid sensor histidine kinase/response regulator n=1 Tax=Geitlerinema sp. PCC 7407 TaxID=1173025 RepID=UPI00029FC583|nr:hybrid sensor histidine kinase/response regulator [Geitlerinema sp. PCC 7407]AFY67173.1 response regulator receiver sensor signal transduction histidine kinase [Geitlerinema sp. PCC 7407]